MDHVCYNSNSSINVGKKTTDIPIRVSTTTLLKKQQTIGRFPKRPAAATVRRTMYSKAFNKSTNANSSLENNEIGTDFIGVGESTTFKRQQFGATAVECIRMHHKNLSDDDNESSCSSKRNVIRSVDDNKKVKNDFSDIDNDDEDDDICPCCCFDGFHDGKKTYLVKNSLSSLSRDDIVLEGSLVAESEDNTDQGYSPSTIGTPSLSRDRVSVDGGRVDSRLCRHRRLSAASAVTITSRLVKSRNSIMSHAKVFLHEIKHTRVIAVIVFINALCWLPLIFLNFADATGNKNLVTPALYLASEIAFLLNSLLMPYIYAFCKHDFKRVFAKLLRDNCPCLKKRKRKRLIR